MLTLEALVVCHVSVVDWPLTITAGLAVREAVGASGEVFTVTAALACAVPPAPFAVRLYVIVEAGVSCREPLAETANPSMLTLEALVVRQVSVIDWPWSIIPGRAVRAAVGAVGGAAGGSLLLLPPPQAPKVTKSTTAKAHRHRSIADRTCKPIESSPLLGVRDGKVIIT